MAPIPNQQVAIHRVTRRHFLGKGLAAGIGAVVLTPRIASTLQGREAETSIPQAPAGFYKGMCYQPMPAPYNPSHANDSWIFFGSDIAYDCMEPLWGASFTSKSGITYCGRNDLETLKDMGVNLLRLYDWEPRNYHKKFLDKCLQLGIRVLAPVSNYFLEPGGGYNNRAVEIPKLLNSFSNGERNTDYHPAIAGIIMGNEPLIPNPPRFGVEQLSQFTKDWVAHERFPTKLKIGHPQDFGLHGGETYPGWNLWTTLLDDQHLGRMKNRLFLATQPQNPANDLFVNFNGDGMGYVLATYNHFRLPLLFTEIGKDRTKPNYLQVVDGQLRESIAYGAAHPEQLLGICHFQFADKVWKCPTHSCRDSEGSFGTHSHTHNDLCVVNYVAADFTHWEGQNEPLKPDILTRNPTYDSVVRTYR